MLPPFAVYVLLSEKDHYFYIGFSQDPLKRLEAHNSGKNPSTRYRGPLVMIFCEFYLYKSDALNREKYFKTSMGKKALKYMLKETLEKLGYSGKKFAFHYDEKESLP